MSIRIPEPKKFWMNRAGAGAKNFETVETKLEPEIWILIPQP